MTTATQLHLPSLIGTITCTSCGQPLTDPVDLKSVENGLTPLHRWVSCDGSPEPQPLRYRQPDAIRYHTLPGHALTMRQQHEDAALWEEHQDYLDDLDSGTEVME